MKRQIQEGNDGDEASWLMAILQKPAKPAKSSGRENGKSMLLVVVMLLPRLISFCPKATDELNDVWNEDAVEVCGSVYRTRLDC